MNNLNVPSAAVAFSELSTSSRGCKHSAQAFPLDEPMGCTIDWRQ
tara:strand:- start:2993 stop:3127 length:135 start_codon:yes stop_codon:yes gene_type:complete